ncbi:MAG: methyl-accepting chemotaxis protein, partial [Treponema sp.]|nr:methyl-accepting chemotaxis protein [Treponema sp.]
MNDKNNLQGKIKKSSLLLMLLLSIGGTIVIFTLVQITLISASAQYNIIKEDSAVYEEVVKGHARSIEKTLWGYQKELDYYVNADVMKTGTFEDMAAWLVAHESDRSKDFDYIMLAGSDGISHNDIGSQTDIANRDYFIEIMKNGKDSFIDNPVISRTNGKPVVHIARAVKRDGRTIAMLAGVIFLNDLTDEFSKIKIGKSGYGWMLASDGTVLYHPNADYRMTANFITDPPSEYKDISSVAKEVASGNLGTGWITGSDGVQDFVVYTGISGSPWGMAFTIPREQIYSVIKSIRYNMLVCGLVSVVITVLIGGLLLYFSIKPLKLVKDTILGIASGDADLTKRITIKKNNNEIGQVVSGFNQFAEKLQSIIKDVKESESELGIAGSDMSASAQDTASAITQIIANIESVHRQIENQGKSVEQTAGAVNEIASNIASLENMIEGQSSGVSEASAAVEQMIGNIKSVNQSVDKMASSFGDLQNDAQLGFNKQQDVNERIRQIEGESEMLQEANAAISAIA